MKRLISGIKPSGEPTLGNYIGAIRQFIEMQKEYESIIFIADLHSITVPIEKDELKKNIKELITIYLACGLDPEYTTIFLQSENLYHANLSWILECNSYMGELSRMTQFKEKSQNKKDNSIGCGLFTYPVLMASDILLYNADIVPVGIDQKQHVELTRDIGMRFNNKYGETFKIPEPIIPKEGEKIKDLIDPAKKMSKSDDNDKGCILLLENLEVARKKIMSATTDSEMIIKFDEENKPGISNLMTIYSSLTNKSMKEIESDFKNCNYGTFKTKVADEVVKLLSNIQEKYKEYYDSDYVEKVLNDGLEKTNKMAKETYEKVIEKVGLIR